MAPNQWRRKVNNEGGGGGGADRESLKLEFYALFLTATLILEKMT